MSEVAAAVRLRRQHPEKSQRVPPGCSIRVSSVGVHSYRNREFWCKGYYVDTVGKNTKAIKEYIENQLKADRESDQLSIYDPRDPFTGSK